MSGATGGDKPLRVLGEDTGEDVTKKGIFAWFVRNPVAANILVMAVMGTGLFTMCTIKQEVFPEVDLDVIAITVAYPGASPEEVEKGITLVTEEAVRGVDGIKKVTSTSTEGFSNLFIELLLGTNPDEALNQVRAAVDRITTFPANAEKPSIFMLTNRTRVISLILYGDQPEAVLKAIAEQAREELLLKENITLVQIGGVRQPEISIEIPEVTLRQYGLTLDQVAAIVRASSIELPAGSVKTQAGEILLRTDERRDTAAELAAVALLSRADGSKVLLGEIAHIVDGFADTDQAAYFNGKRGVLVEVFRVGDEKPLEVAETSKAFAADLVRRLPPGVHIATWFDLSEFYQGRMNLLIDNALQGLVLVIIVLGLFLEVRLAFWVTLGIPTSFLGAAIFLPPADVTINMLSLFAFILALGSVVDDAINIGEAVHRYREEGKSRAEAAILGVKEVAAPVTFAILTIMIAYVPMLFVPGVSGKFFRQIPIVVIGVLAISLVESLFVLPAHLAHSQVARSGILRWVDHHQGRISDWLERVIARFYVPLVRAATRRRYLTLAIALAVLMTTCGGVIGGHIRTTPFPDIESDVVVFEARLPFGSPVERTEALEAELVTSAQQIMAAHGGEPQISRGIFSMVGGAENQQGFMGLGGHITQVMVYLVPIDQRTISATEFARLWRAKMKDYPGVETVQVAYTTGFSAGKDVAIELSHPDPRTLELAAKKLAGTIGGFQGAKDVDDGYVEGKRQLNLRLDPQARAAGMTTFDLANTVRAAFFGSEAFRFQRNRDEVRVFVRLPREERRAEYTIEKLMVRTPTGAEMPLDQVAEIERSRAHTEIKRIDGRRAVEVSADVDDAQGNASEILGKLTQQTLPPLMAEFPGLSWQIGGAEREFQDSMIDLGIGMLLAILVMYVLLSIAFRSYVQPIAVLFAIPFGLVGAVVGHVVMGYTISLMSMLGVVALAGVAINDSLVYVDAINRRRDQDASPLEAAIDAGAIRCRPIVLTATTAFIGMAPLIFETELQARFLIPMAVSLGFGIIFSTTITLLVVPCFYLALEDARRGLRWIFGLPPPASH